MQQAVQNEYIIIEGKNKKHKLKPREYCRWLCLIEGIHLVQQKAEQIKVKLQNLDWIKPLSFQKFIEEREASMQEIIEMKEFNKISTRKESPCVTSLEPVFA